MKTEWKKEIVSSNPQQFEKLNESVYIQRRNITILPPREDDPEDAIQQFECECREIDEDLYNELVQAQNASESNLAIMEALADLYETVSN